MTGELQLRAADVAGAAVEGALIRRGADLVFLAEEMSVRLFVLTAGFVAVGAAVSIWFALITPGASVTFSIAVALIAIGGAAVGLVRPRRCYVWLRYSHLRQSSPVLLCLVPLIANGPDSPTWWVTLAALWVMATVASLRSCVAMALVASGCYLAGTALGGEPLVVHGDAGVLAAAVALPTNTVVGRLVADGFMRFILQMHRLERVQGAPSDGPVKVPNLARRPTPAVRHRVRSPRDPMRVFTPRQLEALLLIRDGLRQSEVASALNVSPRQVERLLASARERAGVATTSALITILVQSDLVPS